MSPQSIFVSPSMPLGSGCQESIGRVPQPIVHLFPFHLSPRISACIQETGIDHVTKHRVACSPVGKQHADTVSGADEVALTR